jgi:hypothetical protein
VKHLRVITWPLRFAIGATLVGIVLVSITGWRATHFEKMVPVSTAPIEKVAERIGSYRTALTPELDYAIDLDPFHPERRRPQIRYELPGSRAAEKPPETAPVSDPIDLLGTVMVAGGRSFAMCQSSAGTQVVHVGEQIAGFTLKSLEQGSAVFVSPQGKAVNIRVKKTGS